MRRTGNRPMAMLRGAWKAAALIMAPSLALALASCSTTRNIPENDRLYIGLTKIEYTNYEKNDHFAEVQEEVEASLACAPNGAVFGSSYYRNPLSFRLSIWNALCRKEGKVAKWFVKNFGKEPVLISSVSPELRASVAQSVLRNHGYMRGTVESRVVDTKNPRKAKVGYTVNMGELFTVDTLEYVNFPYDADSIVRANLSGALVKAGDPFDAAALDAERSRLATLFRNNGFYYFQSGYSTYLADTIEKPGKAKLRLQLADGIPAQVGHEWYIGDITVDLSKQHGDVLTDSVSGRFFKMRYRGRKPPLRAKFILADMKLRKGQMFTYDRYTESSTNLNGTGLFSMVEFNFVPRDTTEACDTLDLGISCVFGKPYDFYLETNYNSKINGRMGPELVLGVTKRNVFRGGEKFDFNIHGTYEWETGGSHGAESNMNSYEFGADVTLEFPRILVPFSKKKHPYYATPSTYAKASFNILRRPNYFDMDNFSIEWTYRWQRNGLWRHEFSPLTIQYQKLGHTTDQFEEMLLENPYLQASMQSAFIPKMRYEFTYSTAIKHRNPVVWTTTFSESSNIISLFYMAAGRGWAEQDKRLLGNAYAQFLKVETDFSKTWCLGTGSKLIGHVAAGAIYTYGNSHTAPYSEQFYVGGANSIRAFATRSVGPGRYRANSTRLSYLDQTGDMKLQLNLEWRATLFAGLQGAVFIDAGNVWNMRYDSAREGSQFKVKNMLKEMALGTGVGIRYDLEFLVIRLDWGVGLHAPYEGKGGFYNIERFKDGQALHLAIGYPF